MTMRVLPAKSRQHIDVNQKDLDLKLHLRLVGASPYWVGVGRRYIIVYAGYSGKQQLLEVGLAAACSRCHCSIGTRKDASTLRRDSSLGALALTGIDQLT